MDDHETFRRAALEAGLPEDEIGRFAEHLRFTIRLAGDDGHRPAGYAGGEPQLPAGTAWPSGAAGPLPFVFSVDCAALPRAGGLALPADGALLFFLDHEEDHLASGTGRVVHVPAGVRVSEPAHVLGATLGAELPGWLGTGDDEEDDEDGLSADRRRVLDDLPHLDQLGAVVRDLWPWGDLLPTAYLGGHVDDEVISGFAEQTLAGREKAGEVVVPVARWYSHVDREAHRLAGEWVSLARFAVSDDLYSGSFVMRHDDLAAGRWDAALSVTAFSE